MKKYSIAALFFTFFCVAAHAQVINTFAGTGVSGLTGDGGYAATAQMAPSSGITVDAAGNLYFTDGSTRLRKIAPSGIISSVAGVATTGFLGDGSPATAAYLNYPFNVCVDVFGNIFIADMWNNKIRKVNTSGIMGSAAGDGGGGYWGDGGPYFNAHIFNPTGVTTDAIGNIYIADRMNNRIRKVTVATGIITTLAGTSALPGYAGDGGVATAAILNDPIDIALDAAGNVYFTDRSNHRIRKIDITAGTMSTVVGTGSVGSPGEGIPATSCRIFYPWGIFIDAAGTIYFAENDRAIRKVDPSGIITTVAGINTLGLSGDHGHATAAQFNGARDVVVDAKNNMYVTDINNRRIRIISPDTTAPHFTAGRTQTLTICTSGAVSVSSMLDIVDPDVNQNEIWTLLTPPTHGTALTSCTVVSTGSGPLTPAGLSYTPTTGYFGPDAFTVIISDPVYPPDTTTIYVSVNAAGPPITGTTNICGTSGTATLSDAATGGTWSSAATGVATIDPVSGVWTAVSAGTAVISYSYPGGCQATTVVTVGTISAITGITNLCSSMSAFLSNTTLGGTWSSSNTTVATITSTGLVSALSPGTATITYGIVSSSCFTTTVVTVNPMPGPITGLITICGATSITLSNATLGGNWSSSSTSVATIDPATGVTTGMSPGSSVITYSFSGGCLTAATVTVAALPAITGTASLCTGGTTSLSHIFSGGSWSSSNTAVATVSTGSGNVTGVSAGTAIITFSVISSGCATTTVVTVSPTPGPITGPLTLCGINTVALGNTVTGGTWTSGSTAVATIDPASGVLTGISPGTSIITYSTSSVCQAYATVTVGILSAVITGTKTVCAGAITSLSNTTVGGTWSSGNTIVATVPTGVGAVSGISPGTAVITYRLASAGCSVTTVVTVTPTPTISGPSSVCQLSSILLTELPATPGIWSSSNTGIAIVNSGGTVTGGAVGTANITYTTTAGCYSYTTISVNPVPANITGIRSVCQGLTTTLTDASTGGNWSSGNTIVATVTGTGTVTGVNAATVTISYTYPSTGCAALATVTVHPSPVISGPSQVCELASITLGTAVSGSWFSTNTTAATVTSTGVVSGNSSGITNIVFTSSFGCVYSKTITVNPIPAAITGLTTMCAGQSVSLSDITSGGVWSSFSTATATVGSLSGFVTGVAAGSVPVSYTLPLTGCRSTTNITVNPQPSISGPSQVCVLSSVTLTELTGTPGAWSSTSAATITPGGILSGVTSGTADITFTATSGGCTDMMSIAVNPLPAVITGTATICAGAATSLGSATAGGNWSSSNTAIATVAASGVATAVVTGSPAVNTATITYQLPVTGCLTSTLLTVNPQPLISGPSSVCVSRTISLFEATGTAGAWSSAATSIAGVSASGLVSGTSAGTATIIYTAATGGCVTSKTVTVNPLPAPVTGAATVCQHTTTLLSDADAGGVWSSSAAGIASVSSTGDVMGLFPGSPVISYTFPTGCYSTATVTVLAAPVVTVTASGPTSFCPGGSVVLNATPGFSYQWYNGASIIPGATAVAYTAITTGSFAVTATNATGCVTQSAGVTVATGATPVIHTSGLTSFCFGNSITLTAYTGSATGTITYQWERNGTIVSGATSVTYLADSAGIYSCAVHITSSIGTCAGLTPAILITVNPLPHPAIHKSGGNYVTDNHSYPNYQWYLNASPIPGANTWSVTPVYPGSYRVAVTDTNGCTGYSTSIFYNDVVINVGTGIVNIADIHIYPNPANNAVFISSPLKGYAVLTGVEGRALITEIPVVAGITTVDIANLASGIYFITLYNENGERIKTEKLVKE